MAAFTAPDRRRMQLALALARRGLGRVSPNPLVGCVLVRGGRIVGRGWHERFGGPHAEVRALAQAGARARGAHAYVTLEPCGFFGKTPPCTDALIRSGVRAVTVAMRDPDPRSRGRGLAKLRRAGLSVRTGLLEEEARELNRAFLVNQTEGRPYVVLKAAVSLDGKVCTASGESKWITSPLARREGWRLRAAADAVLIGIGTVLEDDPSLTARGLGRDPVRIVLDTRLRTPAAAKLLQGGPRTILATASTRSPAKGRAEVLRVGAKGGRVDLRRLLKKLHRGGIGILLVEGGPTVATAFLDAGLVDELRLFVAPKLIGGVGAPGFFEGRGTRRLALAPRLTGTQVRRIGPDFLWTGRLER